MTPFLAAGSERAHSLVRGPPALPRRRCRRAGGGVGQVAEVFRVFLPTPIVVPGACAALDCKFVSGRNRARQRGSRLHGSTLPRARQVRRICAPPWTGSGTSVAAAPPRGLMPRVWCGPEAAPHRPADTGCVQTRLWRINAKACILEPMRCSYRVGRPCAALASGHNRWSEPGYSSKRWFGWSLRNRLVHARLISGSVVPSS